MISELRNLSFSRHWKPQFTSDPYSTKLTQSENTDKHKREMKDTKFNKIATQLRPMVKALQILGGYPISTSTCPEVIKTDNCSTILTNVIENGGENQFKKKANFHKSETENEEIILNSSPQKLFYLTAQTYLEIKVSTSGSSAVPESETLHIYEAIVLKWSQVEAWYSYVLKTLTIFSLFTFLTNLPLHVAFPVKLFSHIPNVETRSNASKTFYDLTIGTSCILKLIESIFLFCNSHQLVVWLNKWSSFERQFLNCFGSNDKFNNYNLHNKKNWNGNFNGSATLSFNFDFDICKFRNKVFIFYFLIPCMTWFVVMMIYRTTLVVLNIPFVSWVCFLLAAFALWGYPLLEDCKVFLMLKSIELTLKQIRLGIQKYGKQAQYITTLDVIAWRNLITETRKQTTIGARYLKSQQMIAVAETIISCTCSIGFVLIANHNQELDVESVMGTVYYFLCNFLRLYCKILLAENIAAEELRIAEAILEIEGRCTTNENGVEMATKSELKFLYNLLTQNTIKVNIGNYFTLSKPLLLQVCAQVVTYIIVIMQFQSGKN